MVVATIDRGLEPAVRCSIAIAGARALDVVHVRLLHLLEELAGVGREALHVLPLALGVERVERQRRLAGAAQARDDRQRVPRDVNGDVLEVVLPRPRHNDIVLAHMNNWLFSTKSNPIVLLLT